MAMAISAVAACACAHHESKRSETEVLSCHAASHEPENTKISDYDPHVPRLGEQCTCSLNRVHAAFFAKSEQKKLKAQATDIAGNAAPVQADEQFVSTAEAATFPVNFEPYTRNFPRSGPSRAPPRL